MILTNQKFCFKNSSTFETGLSDHHHLIYSILKTTFKKEDSKRLVYRECKNFNNEYFKMILKIDRRNALEIMNHLQIYLSQIDMLREKLKFTRKSKTSCRQKSSSSNYEKFGVEIEGKYNKITKRFLRLQKATKSCSQIKQREKY